MNRKTCQYNYGGVTMSNLKSKIKGIFLLLTVIISMFISSIAFADQLSVDLNIWKPVNLNGNEEIYMCNLAYLPGAQRIADNPNTADIRVLYIDKIRDRVISRTYHFKYLNNTYVEYDIFIQKYSDSSIIEVHDYYINKEQPISSAPSEIQNIYNFCKPLELKQNKNSSQNDEDAAAVAAADAADAAEYRTVSFDGVPSQVNESLLGKELLIRGVVYGYAEKDTGFRNSDILGLMKDEGGKTGKLLFAIKGARINTTTKYARISVKRSYETKRLIFVKGTLKRLGGQLYIDVTEAQSID